jgi:hypothetical protein
VTGVLAPWNEQVADAIDPDARRDQPELATPTTLAAHLDPSYQVRAHLTLIGEELAALDRGDSFDRLMLNTPPRVGKTKTAVEWFAFWWLIKHPTERIIVGSYGDSLARRAGQHIRRMIERYGARYGLMLERGSAAANDWSLTTGGGVKSVGVGSGITGHDGDLIVIDDPTKSRAEAESVARRDAIWDWYSADIGARVVPGTRMVLVQTPWHPDDLRARVVQQEGDHKNGGAWRVVLMAALAEDPHDPLGRGWGEPLPHPKIADGDTAKLTAYWERMRSSRATRDWRALYQCDPKAPEGQLVKADLLRQRRCFEHGTCDGHPQRAGVAIDPSGGGRDTAGVVAGYRGEDGRLYFTHDSSAVMPSEDWARAACELAAKTAADFFVFEANYGGDMAGLVIRTAWDKLRTEHPGEYGMCPRIKSVHARKGKVLRAEPVGQQWVEDRIRMARYLPDLESEWATWVPGPESPGRIDASVYLAYELLDPPSAGETDAAFGAALSETDLLGGTGMFGRR